MHSITSRKPTAQEGNHKSQSTPSGLQSCVAEHVPTPKKKKNDIEEEQIEEQDPRGPHSGHSEDNCEDEPCPEVHCESARELGVELSSTGIGICC